MADVFISYARRDRGRIQRLLDGMEEPGLSVWYDDGTLDGGNLEATSMRELAGASAVVVVWSTTSVRSRVVRSEAEIAQQQGKLVPVRTDGAPVPRVFSNEETGDLRAWAGDADDPDWLQVLDRILTLVDAGGQQQPASAYEERAPIDPVEDAHPDDLRDADFHGRDERRTRFPKDHLPEDEYGEEDYRSIRLDNDRFEEDDGARDDHFHEEERHGADYRDESYEEDRHYDDRYADDAADRDHRDHEDHPHEDPFQKDTFDQERAPIPQFLVRDDKETDGALDESGAEGAAAGAKGMFSTRGDGPERRPRKAASFKSGLSARPDDEDFNPDELGLSKQRADGQDESPLDGLVGPSEEQLKSILDRVSSRDKPDTEDADAAGAKSNSIRRSLRGEDEAEDPDADPDTAWGEVKERVGTVGLLRIGAIAAVVLVLTGVIVSFFVLDPLGMLPGSDSQSPELAALSQPEKIEQLPSLQGTQIPATGGPEVPPDEGQSDVQDPASEAVPASDPSVIPTVTDPAEGVGAAEPRATAAGSTGAPETPAGGLITPAKAGTKTTADAAEVAEESTEKDRPLTAGTVFKDCEECPSMVVIPPGSFVMGSPDDEEGREAFESPRHAVEIKQAIAIGRYEITYEEWDACLAAGGCGGYRPSTNGTGRGRMPVVFLEWYHAKSYVDWLTRRTGKPYRLLSEAEWEYAARAGTTTPFAFGTTISTDQANYHGDYVYGTGRRGKVRNQSTLVGSFKPNKFGLFDMHGNVWEWVEDCWNPNYRGAPTDGSPMRSGQCDRHVVRGGAWAYPPALSRSASRSWTLTQGLNYVGFRVAQDIPPQRAELREIMQP